AALTVDGAWTTSTTITDVAGNTSGATAGGFTLDVTAPTAPAVSLPESPNGVSAAEAASAGGTPLTITLAPGARVGDTISSVVTSPGGTTLTLTTVLTSADLPPSQGGTSSGSAPFTIQQVIPSLALVENGTWATTTRITDVAGNVGPASTGSFSLDTVIPSAPAIALPESPNGVSAAEAASVGGTPIVVTLPADARVGDSVATVVTNPNGTATTLTTVLTAADLPASQGGTATGSGPFTISQVVPSAALTIDGAWTTSTTLTDVAGNASAAIAGGFTLDISAPSAPAIALPESPNGVSAAEAASVGGTPIVVTLPANAKVGDTVATVVTNPNGTATTLTTVLTAADLPASQGGTATGSGPFTISQVVPSAALTVDGAWTTSTTITDVAGNTSGATAGGFTLDVTAPTAPAVSLPESPNGVSAAEAASAGGTPIVVTLPANAKVGDTVTTVVTNPNGTATTLTTVLTAADLPASQGGTATGSGPFTISQVVPSAALTVDGAWTTSTTITDVAGNASAPTAGGFTLDVTAPTAPTVSLAEAPLGVSATEAASGGGTPLRVALPAEARAGDSVTTEVTRPNGSKFNLSAVLTSADIVQGSVSLLIATSELVTDGNWSTSTTLTDVAGNTGAPATAGFVLDVQTPSAPGASLSPASDSGVTGDNLTRDNTPTLTGTGATPGDTITVRDAAGNVVATAVVLPDGSWGATLLSALPEGVNPLQIIATDPFGNSSPATPLSLTIDTRAPAVPGAAIATASDSGVVGDGLTNDSTPTIQGSGATPGDRITVTMPGTGEVLTATVASNGTWSVTPTQPLADGTTGNVQVVASDAAGNASGSASVPITIDLSPPAAPVAALDAASDTGVAADRLTRDSSPTITGTGTPGNTITLKDGTTVLGTAVVAPDGSWSITPASALSDGEHPFKVTATDLAGNTSAATDLPVTIDTAGPLVTITSVAGDTVDNDPATVPPPEGVFDANERGTNPASVSTLPSISGTTTAEAGQIVSVTLNGRTVQATVLAGGSGQPNAWSAVLTQTDALALNHGNTYALTASVTDRAGNAATDVDNTLLANVAAPDVPIVVERYVSTLTPTLTGSARKIDNANNAISLTSGDTLSVTVEGYRYSVAIGGASSVTRLSDNTSVAGGLIAYSTANATWAVTLAPGNLTTDGDYDVVVNATAAGVSRVDVSSTELHVNRVPPSIAINPVSPDSAGRSVVNGNEDDQAITITGTTSAEVGATVTLTGLDGTTRTATVLAGASGQPNTFSLVIPGAQVDLFTEGAKTLVASVTNRYGLAGTDNETVLIDTVAPSAPVSALDAASDSGATGDSLTNDATPTLSGTGTPGDAITIRDAAGRVIASAIVQPDGSWSATPTQPLPEGANALSVTATDSAGNESAAASLPITIDTRGPAAPAAVLTPASDTGTSGDGLTSDDTPTLSGSGASPGDRISVTMPGTGEVLTATVAADGSWSVTPTLPLANGTQGNVTITASDPAGNTSPPTTLPLSIDTQAPSAAGIVLPEAPLGVNRAEAVSSGGTPLVITLPADARVGDTVATVVTKPGGGTITLSTVLSAADLPPAQGGTAAGSGPFTITQVIADSRLSPDGAWTTSTVITDQAGNAGAAAAGSFTLDTTISTPVAALDPTSDTGVAGDGRTSDATPTISGTGTPGDTITVKDAAGNVIATASVQPDGSWSATPTSALSDGMAILEITATDAAGNVSDPVRAPVTIDTIAPAAPVFTSATDNAGTITGALIAGARTDDPTPTLVFSAEPGATVRIFDGATLLGLATEGPAGTFSFTPAAALTDGLHRFSATATDASGSASGPSIPFPLTVDTAVPAAPVLVSVTDDIPGLTGGLAAGSATNDARPTLVFTAEPGAALKVYDGSTLLGTATEGPAGTYTFTPPAALAEGSHSFTARATDLVGNDSAASSPFAVTVDTISPASPSVTISEAAGGVNSAEVASGGGVPLTITLPADAKVGDTVTTVVTTPYGTPITLSTVLQAADLPASQGGTASGSGPFTIDQLIPTASLTIDGSWTASTSLTDTSGNSTSAIASGFTLDTTEPLAPVLVSATDDVGPVTGALSGGASTNDTRPTLVFTAEPGSTLRVYDGATLLGTATEGPAGRYTLVPANALSDGTYSLNATATDAAGNTSVPSAAFTLTVDTAPPAAPVLTSVTDDLAPGTGALASAARTNDATPTIEFSAEPGSTVRVYDGAALLGTATEGPSGTFTFTPASALADGTHNFSAVATDAAGNVGASSSAFPITIDTASPGNPTLVSAADDAGLVTGLIASGGRTDDTQPTLVFNAEPGSTVKVYDGSTLLGTATESSSTPGTFTFTPASALSEGAHSLTATATDIAGNTSGSSTPFSLTVDSTAPAAPMLVSATDDVGPVTGALTSGGATNDTQPTLVFTAEPGSTVALYDGATLIGQAIEGPAGTFTFTPATPLSPGNHSLTATATDAAGNTSGGSTPFALSVDTTAPAAPVIAAVADDVSPVTTASLASGATTNDATPALSLTAEAGSTVRIYNGSTLLGTATESSPGNFTFTPASALADGAYSLTATATDAAGNVSAASSAFRLTVDTAAPATPAVTSQLTHDTTPVITGTAVLAAGETLRITVSGATYTVTPGANGSWSLDLGTATPVSGTTLTPLTAGTVSVTARVTDAAGNESTDSTSGELQIDLTPPATPTVAALTTSDTTPVITGTASLGSGETLKVVVNGATYAVTPASDGSWSLDLQTAVPVSGTLGTFANNQSYPVTATAYDAAGNTSSDSTTNELVIDLNALSAQLAASSDSGIAGDRITRDDTPRIEGTTGPGATVTIAEGGVTLASVVADATTGAWGVDTSQLADGVHTLTITDSASKTTTLQITIDRTPPTAPLADLDAASDTGTPGDRITSDTTPTISGQGTAGDVITIKDAQGSTVATATVQSDGTWSATPLVPLAEGLNTLSITATDPHGNVSSPTSLPITIDTTAPLAPTAVLDPASDSGVVGDSKTNDSTPTLSGTGSPGDTITVRNAAGALIATGTVQPDGTWSATPATALPEGLNTLSIKATDPAGNTGPAATLALTIDTTAPAAPAAVLDPASDSGVTGDSRTSDTTPTLSGTGTPGDTITVKDGAGNTIATGTVQADGTWTATPATPLTDGPIALAISATDPAGNISGSTALPITIDSTAPAAPTVTSLITNDTTPVITGTAVLGAGETLSVTVGGATYTVVPAGGGAWSLDLGSATPVSGTLAALADGVISVTATARDAAGNSTSDTTSGEIRLDTQAPAAPTVTALTTSDTTPVITGSATLAAGEVLRVAVNGATYSVTPASDGTWSLDLQTASPVSGSLGAFANNQQYPVTASAIDAAGNVSTDPSTNELSIDLNALSAQLASASDSGIVGDRITNDDTPTIEGITGPGATVTLLDGTTVVATVVAHATTGVWSVDTSQLPQGLRTLAITDSLNKTVSLPITIDRTAPATPTLVSVTDNVPTSTGSLTSGASSDDTTPTLVFTAEPGSTLNVYNGTTLLGAATEGPSGTFTFTPASPLAEGVYALNAKATDAHGNTSGATSNFNLTIDTTAPAAPVLVSVTDDVAGVTGSLASGATTNDARPELVFTAEAGSTVHVYDGSTLLGSATEGPSGTFTFTPSTALVDGAHNFTAKATDAAGNSSSSSSAFPVTIDTVAPSAPTVLLTEAANSVNAAEATSGSGTPIVITLPSDARVGDTVTTVVTRPNGTTTTLSTTLGAADLPAAQGGTASGSGPFTISQVIPTSELSNANNGAWTTSTTVTDPAGNASTAASGGFTLDTVAPTAPTVVAATVATVLPTVTGTAATGVPLVVTIGSGSYSVTPNGSGQWSLDLATETPVSGTAPILVDGQSYSVTATSTDAAGNAVNDSTASELTIQLVVAAIAITSDPDNLTNDTTPVITGTSSLGVTPVTVNFGDATYTVTPDSNGNWTLDTGTATPTAGLFAPNVNGSNAVVASVQSPSGTRVTANQSLVIDTTAPVISVTSVSGDTVTASGNGSFDLAERGFDPGTYALNSTVTTLPVISGTTDAEAGQTVTVSVNRVDYTGTVSAGAGSNTWSVTLTDTAARALNHGGIYSIAARVTDAAGNSGSDLDNGIAVNVAPPDVPTVVSQTAGSTTPTLTGTALKKVVSTAAETTAGASGTAEVQTLSNLANALGANQRVTLTVGGVTLTTAALDATPTVAELAAALVAASGYSAAPFTVAASGNNLVLTWKTPGVVSDVASLASFRSLETGDALTVAIKDNSGATTLATTSLTIGGSSSPAGLTYDTTTGNWSLAVSAAANLVAGGAYNVDVATTVSSGGTTVSRSDLSSLELSIIQPPSITSIPEATSGSVLNLAEALSDGGTPVNVSLTGTGAVAGQVLVLSWGAQTFSYVITAADITAGAASIVVPTSVLQAETADGTSETIPVSVRLDGASSASQNVSLNFVRPAAPTINATAWAASGAANSSNVSGIGEAVYDINSASHATAGTADGVLYLSETAAVGSTITAGTVIRVQLPTSGSNLPVANDSLTVNFGTQAFNAGLITSAERTANYKDVTIPDTVLLSQPYGTVSVSAQVISAATGNPSLAKPVSISWAWDLPLARPASGQYGFAINGASANDVSGYQVANLGDFNGDGYDDIAVTAPQSDTNGLTNNGAVYVVYGKPGLQNVELSNLAAGGSSEGFMIRGGLGSAFLGFAVSSAGDTNGDGLADLLVASAQSATDNLLGSNTGNANARTFVVYGTSSNATLNLSSLAASQGYSLQLDNVRFGNAVSAVGDINADGFDDFAIARGNMTTPATPQGIFVLYGTSEARSGLQMVDRT
ncbi:MAG: FG-GAP repeat protein, partial [Betaproteobacteria bacterium]|nr:FG-GAP repeat protein [Betaproteobacteria bacterium]